VAVRVALTIDTEQRGRPASEGNPGRLLDVLAAAATPATFFVQGRWAGAYPALTRRIRTTAISSAITLTTTLRSTCSPTRHPRFRRPRTGGHRGGRRRGRTPVAPLPYGRGEDDPRVLGLLSELGYRQVGWDFETDDWEDGRDTGELVETVVAGAIACGDGARVLLHSWPDVTAAALPRIIAGLKAPAPRW